MDLMDDTIAAIATPVGMGGIGIIRLSGPRSVEIATHLFRPHHAPPPFKSHYLYYGEIVDPHTGDVIDEALLSFMAKPQSYTREDVVELNCHGGYLVLREALSLVVKAGARLAEPGEFTKRAFLNGRLDLAQAEAVVDLIESRSTTHLRHASSQLQGMLSQEINTLQKALIEICSSLEASIEFPEEDLEPASPAQLITSIDHLISQIKKLLHTYAEGKLYREGVSTIIAGKPNAGKSSLFNVLLGEERTIVTPVPGTTRDFIEEVITVNSIPLTIMDTAGLRDPEDAIEEEGVRKTKDKLDQADLILLVIDGSVDQDDRVAELVPDAKMSKIVVICNKVDLPRKVSLDELQRCFPGSRIVATSALYKRGIEELKETIASLITTNSPSSPAQTVITNLRHKVALEKTMEALKEAQEGLHKNIPPEFTAADLQSALHCLGEITGQTSGEEVLDQIFSRFCIGK
jgi:tRNA modification GTPase